MSHATCRFSSCARAVHAGGLCNGHYAQFVRRRPLTRLRAYHRSGAAAASMRGPWSGCWVWQGPSTYDGYGYLAVRGRNYGTHRLVYESLFGSIPDGLLVCHRCDNPPCFNPAHLFVGSQRDNSDDKVQKNRQSVVRRHIRASDAADIRERFVHGDRENTLALAEEFGLRPSSIYAITGRRTWR